MKRFLSFVLVLVMVMTLLPAGALADEATITRAEWIQSLVKTFDMTVEEDNYPDNYFSDIEPTAEYYRDMLVATEFGVIDVPAGEPFYPDLPATRGFAAHTLNFCLGYQLDAEAGYTYAESADASYPDDIQIAINRGWFKLSGGKFMPQQAITSVEAKAMLSDAAAVISGNVVSENYDSVYEFAKDVVVIPEGNSVSVENDTVTITDCPRSIAIGDVFAVYINGIPNAYIANSVSKSGRDTVVSVSRADDADVFETIDAQGVVYADLSQVEALDGTELSYYIEETEQTFKSYAKAKAAAKGTIKPKNISLKLKNEVEVSDGLKFSVSGKVKDPVVEYNINLSKGRAYVKLSYDMEVNYEVKGDFLPFTCISDINDIDLFYWGIPGIGGFTITYDVELSGSVKGIQSTHVERELTVSVKDGVQMKKDFYAKAFSLEVAATGQIGFEAKFGVTELPVFNVYFYGKVGAVGKLKSTTYGDENKPERCTHFAAYLYAECGVKGKVKLLNFEKSLDLKHEFYNEDNSPVRIVHHYEDGTLVPECTRGDISSWFGGGGFRYHTPAGSAYMSSGWYAGNGSIGFDRYGKPVVLYTYTLDDNGNATITSYRGNANALIIPSTLDGHTVVAIGNSAFKGNMRIRSIIIPNTVSVIGEAAFFNCANLNSVTLPDNLVKLCGGAFAYCSSLIGITIPKTIESAGIYSYASGYNIYDAAAFTGCSNLKHVEIEDGITRIPDNLFYTCNGIESITIPNTVTEIGEAAFFNCANLNSVTLPDNLVKLCGGAFAYCSNLTSITIPKTIENAGIYSYASGYNIYDVAAFTGCANLKHVEIEDGITRIPDNLFYTCDGIESVIIPNSVTEIGKAAFYNCINLNSVTLPDNLLKLCGGAFAYCYKLSDITIPNSLESVGYYTYISGFNYYDIGAFTGCSNLKRAEIGNGVSKVYEFLFYGCNGLESISIPKTVTEIENNAFSGCSKLSTISIPDSVTSVGANAFKGCSSLGSIVVPNSVTSMGTNCFANCTSLKDVTLPNIRQNIMSSMFSNCTSLETITLPDTVTTIQSSAFEGCTSLKTINWSKSITTIQQNAFKNCDTLTEITIPGTVTSVGNAAFYDCDTLKAIYISDGVTSLGSEVFANCDSLTSITIPDSVTSIGKSIFYDCDALTEVKLGSGITAIPESMCNHCDSLESIVIPRRVTTIGNYAFKDSVKFEEVTIPRSTTSIAANAFSYPAKLTVYGIAGTFAESFANDIGARFVDKQVNATNITLGSTELLLNKNATAKLTMTATPADFTDEVTWKSADTSVATIADDGTVKAVGVGTTTIKLAVGDVSASCKVTVVQPVTSVSLNKTSLSMEALGTYQLTATANPSNAYDKTIKWSSSDPAVATVDENGLVTAIGKGSATITATATAVSGVSRSCTVSVTNNGVQAKSVDELESPHNYTSNCSDIWLYTLPGAASISVSFDARTSMEDGFDYLYLYDAAGKQVGKYTGTELAGKTVDIEGNTVKIKLVSDNGGNDWGFKVTSVKEQEIHTHSYAAVITKPTCTEKGYTTYTCTCGESYKDNYVNALGHSFGAWTQTKASTCTAKGTETRYCSGCDKTETRDVKALGHDYQKGSCTRCGDPDPDYKISAPKISVTKAASGKPTVKWPAVDGAVKYKVYRATSKSGTYSLMLTTTKLSYTNTSAKAGTTYYYKVKAVNASDKTSSYSNIVSLKATLGKPDVTISTVASTGKIKLTWDKVDGATKYEIYRATSKTGTYSKLTTTTSTSYTNTSAKVGTAYYYKVRAINGTTAANSSYSDIHSMTCDCAQPVVSISVVASSGKIKLTWKAVEGATKYEIWRATSKTGTYTKMYTTTSTSYTNSTAKPGTTYYYKVKAIASKSAANSAYSAIKSMTCDLAQPVVKITTSSGDPNLSWDKVTGATKYEVYRATSKTGTYTKLTTVTGTSYTNTSAKAGTTYYYKVIAVGSKSAANSAFSTVVSIKAK